MKVVNFSFILILVVTFSAATGCPYTIKNDSNHTLIVVDPHNKQAIFINPGKKHEIDPSIYGWQHYVYYEKLDFYVPHPKNPHLLYRRYQLVENYCIEGKTDLALSNIAKLVKKPTKRLEVSEFKPHKHSTHTH